MTGARPVRIHFVVMFFVLAELCGFTALAAPLAGNPVVWNLAAIGCLMIFLLLFVRILASHAAASVMRFRKARGIVPSSTVRQRNFSRK